MNNFSLNAFLSIIYLTNLSQIQGKNALTASHELVEILKIDNIDHQKKTAKWRLLYLKNSLEADNPFLPSISEIIGDYAPDRGILENVKQFLSGTRSDYYCRGTGLVYSKALHNDGTKSELALISGNRTTFKNTYNKMAHGQWIYGLKNKWLKNTLASEVGIADAHRNGFYIRESQLEERDGSGIYKMSLDNSCHVVERSFHSVGSSYFPAKLHLPFEFAHLWGQLDAGYCIEFKLGFTDQLEVFHPDLTGLHKLHLKTTRVVSQHFPQFKFEFDSRQYEFKDCWKVQLTIESTNNID